MSHSYVKLDRLTAIALLFCASAATGADLGRLFFTPAQRAALDNARRQNIRIESVSEKVQTPAPPLPQNVSVNGVVRRSDGKSTVWLNNRPVTERSAGGINVSTNKNDSRVRLTVPDSDRSVDLKVGQTVEIVSGTIEEGYARRTTPQTRASRGRRPASGAEKVVAPPATPPQISAQGK